MKQENDVMTDSEIEDTFQRLVEVTMKIADMIDNSDTLSPQEKYDKYTLLIDGFDGLEKGIGNIEEGLNNDTGRKDDN